MWRRLALVLSLAALPAAAEEPDRIMLAPDRESLAAAGWIVRIEPEDGVHESHAVTDATLDVVTWEGRAEEALLSADQPGRSPWDWAFGVQFMLVADGRLFRWGGGMCSPFEGDYSVCTVECDGGHFALRRTLTQQEARIDMVLAPLPKRS